GCVRHALGDRITVPYATPSYAAGCYGTGCIGKDPQANCSESPITTLESRTLRGVGGSPYSIQLRYSPTCLAFWARGIREDCAILQTLWVHIAGGLSHFLLNRCSHRRRSGGPCQRLD